MPKRFGHGRIKNYPRVNWIDEFAHKEMCDALTRRFNGVSELRWLLRHSKEFNFLKGSVSRREARFTCKQCGAFRHFTIVELMQHMNHSQHIV